MAKVILLCEILLHLTVMNVDGIRIIPKELESLTSNVDISKSIKFFFYNRENSLLPLEIFEGSTTNYDSLDPNHITHVIVHGWVCKIATFDAMKDAILENHNYNVITVSWPSFNPDYLHSKRDTVVVGTHTAKLLDNLVLKRGLNLTKVHVVGHSLGAHIAGIIGNKVSQGKIGRITGLDPAGPMYDKSSTPADERLSLDDAECVQVIHTNAGLLGTSDNLGHADFYVNGGHSQKGCDIADLAAGTCSHMRAIYLYREWVKKNIVYKAITCKDWKTYKKGRCSKNKSAIMGGDVNTNCPKGVYFIETAGTQPFQQV